MAGGAELVVPYDPEQRALYEKHDRRSMFHGVYPRRLWRGIYKLGRFPEVAVLKSLTALGFSVLMSDPDMPNKRGYILTHYAGKRRNLHPAFTRMFRWFPRCRIAELNRECDAAKRRISSNPGGGDPDLFVFSTSGDCFFVEVKDQDELLPKQRLTFSKIEQILGCDVLIARVKAEPGATPGDGLQVVHRPVNKVLPPTSRAQHVNKVTPPPRATRG